MLLASKGGIKKKKNPSVKSLTSTFELQLDPARGLEKLPSR